MKKQSMTLKEIQDESFNLLKVLKNICEEQNITYWLSFGTLLGAIRNNDFIPWDDDVDIFMPRKDFEAFVSYCKNNESSLHPFRLFHYKTCNNYIYPIGRFSNTEFVFKSFVKDYGLGIFIDIYPIDGYNNNDKEQIKRIWKQKKIIGRLIADKCPPGFSKIKFYFLLLLQLFYGKGTLQRRIENIDIISQKYSFDSSEYVSALNWEPAYFYPKKYFASVKPHLFHGEYFNVPIGFDEFLSDRYGNYMELPPESKRVPHHDYEMHRKF